MQEPENWEIKVIKMPTDKIMQHEWPIDGEEIMTDDTHCFDCEQKLDECECEDETE